MAVMNRWKYLSLAYFSKPKHDRAVYRLIKRSNVKRVLEIGIGDGLRAVRMVFVAGQSHSPDAIRYAGVDLFEGRSPNSPKGISLKEAHRLLKPTGAKIHLVPGDPLSALTRCANVLPDTDLVVISRDVDIESLAQAWFYVPRMLHAHSIVLKETVDEGGSDVSLVEIPRTTIDARANAAQRGRRAA